MPGSMSALTRQREALRGLAVYARRLAPATGDAEDLVQEALIEAIRAGYRDFADFKTLRWLRGVVRNKARHHARTRARAMARDQTWYVQQSDRPTRNLDAHALVLSSDMSPSLRLLALLALSGHSRAEIAYLLGITDAALRQRVRALKKALAQIGAPGLEEFVGLRGDLNYGQIRRHARSYLAAQRGDLATHDPDGHVFIVRRSQK
ncbi:MAG: sigma factor [Pseudomonadota bacterium]